MMYHNSSSDELKLQDGRVSFFTKLLHCSLMWSISWMNLIHHSLPYLYINSALVRHTNCIVRTSFDFFSKNEFRFPELFLMRSMSGPQDDTSPDKKTLKSFLLSYLLFWLSSFLTSLPLLPLLYVWYPLNLSSPHTSLPLSFPLPHPLARTLSLSNLLCLSSSSSLDLLNLKFLTSIIFFVLHNYRWRWISAILFSSWNSNSRLKGKHLPY